MSRKQSGIIYSLDYLRIIACFMVIGIHSIQLLSENTSDALYVCFNHFVRIGLPLFFVLSSIALDNKVDYINNLRKYYLNKFLNIGIWFIAFSVFYYEYSNSEINSVSAIIKNIPLGLLAIFQGSQYYHLWYMYALIGLILWLPFLKCLIKKLSFKQHFYLSIMLFACSVLKIYFNIPIDECHWTTWGIYYIIGALVLRDECRKYYGKIVLISLIAYFCSILIELKIPGSILMAQMFTFGPLMIVQVLGFFAFFIQFNEKIKDKITFNAFIHKVSQLTYLIYLCHPIVIDFILNEKLLGFNFPLFINNRVFYFVFVVFFTFVLSAIVAKGLIVLKNLSTKFLNNFIKIIKNLND